MSERKKYIFNHFSKSTVPESASLTNVYISMKYTHIFTNANFINIFFEVHKHPFLSWIIHNWNLKVMLAFHKHRTPNMCKTYLASQTVAKLHIFERGILAVRYFKVPSVRKVRKSQELEFRNLSRRFLTKLC